MNKYLQSLLAFVVVLVLLSACGSSKNRAEESNFDRIDSLRAHFLTIEDSLVYAWNVMIKDDNERISDMARLLDELKYAQAADSTITDSLKAAVNELKAHRYFMTKMTSVQIDQYDSISMSLSRDIITLVDGFEDNNKYPYMAELTSSIQKRENQILHYRIGYDRLAKVHNNFVKEHEKILDQIDPEYHHTVLPLFELGSEN